MRGNPGVRSKRSRCLARQADVVLCPPPRRSGRRRERPGALRRLRLAPQLPALRRSPPRRPPPPLPIAAPTLGPPPPADPIGGPGCHPTPVSTPPHTESPGGLRVPMSPVFVEHLMGLTPGWVTDLRCPAQRNCARWATASCPSKPPTRWRYCSPTCTLRGGSTDPEQNVAAYPVWRCPGNDPTPSGHHPGTALLVPRIRSSLEADASRPAPFVHRSSGVRIRGCRTGRTGA